LAKDNVLDDRSEDDASAAAGEKLTDAVGQARTIDFVLKNE
jgi:hypothetical protein